MFRIAITDQQLKIKLKFNECKALEISVIITRIVENEMTLVKTISRVFNLPDKSICRLKKINTKQIKSMMILIAYLDLKRPYFRMQ